MGDWKVDFFPPSGENNSPYDYILGLTNKKEQGQTLHRLETMSKLEIADWPSLKIHKIVDKIFQLPAGAHRALFCLENSPNEFGNPQLVEAFSSLRVNTVHGDCLDSGTIVVLHACRKVGRKTKPAGIQGAQIHYAEYMSQK